MQPYSLDLRTRVVTALREPGSRQAAVAAWLVAYVEQHPDVTLTELNQAWQAQGTAREANLPLASAR